jgi:hypothetical protein
MSKLTEPSAHEMKLAKAPHDIFISNLIGNHILLFTAISTFGPSYMKYLLITPVLSFIALAYTFYRSSRVKREDSEFIYIHWQIARRWSTFFAKMLLLMTVFVLLAYVAINYWGWRAVSVYPMAGIGILPTLVTVFALAVIESDSLHHARMGTLPKWAQKRFLGIDPDEESTS